MLDTFILKIMMESVEQELGRLPNPVGKNTVGKRKGIKREGKRLSKSYKFFIMRDHSSKADSGLLNNVGKNKSCLLPAAVKKGFDRVLAEEQREFFFNVMLAMPIAIR